MFNKAMDADQVLITATDTMMLEFRAMNKQANFASSTCFLCKR